MNEEYLWNKTGEDAETEKLENALKAFRYRETAPPVVHAKQAVFEEELPRRRWFPFVFAFASSAALILLAFVFLFNFSTKQVEEAKTSNEIVTPKLEEKTTAEIPVEPTKIAPTEKIETAKTNVQPKTVKVRQIVQLTKSATKNPARKTEAKKPFVKLTDEEKYAYDQLMLALSITGSKLKIVQDKIQNIDETNVSKTER
ncbi:MAG: hypothetical protein LUM44_08250 [Pyrinomonadaceae bacterium]|nr:hypothetical protein [Pyrinomonadaceae bacterium]